MAAALTASLTKGERAVEFLVTRMDSESEDTPLKIGNFWSELCDYHGMVSAVIQHRISQGCFDVNSIDA